MGAMLRFERLTAVFGILLAGSSLGSAQTVSFVEPEAGRAPLTNAFDQAKKSIDIYLFKFLDDGITASLTKAVARGVVVRAILEPCSGDSTCPKPNKDGITGCTALLASGIQTKWANQAFPKTHAKMMVIDGSHTLVTTINIEPQSFSTRRDYGLATDDRPLLADFNRVFAQDWGSDDPIKSCSQLPQDRRPDGTVQSYATLIVSPDNGREVILGLIASAKVSLKIQVEQVDPQASRGIVLAMVAAVKAGVRLQLLMDSPVNQPNNQAVADAINAAGGDARFQTNYRTHAKMMLIDGQKVFLGSQNLTSTSLDQRRELGWTTIDLQTITCFQQVFDADWLGQDGHLPNGVCPPSLALVSTASYNGAVLAAESIAAAFGSGLATATQGANSITLPTAISGVTVQVKDSAGTERLAPLFFVSQGQVNFEVPAGTALGPANITIGRSSGTGTIAAVAPGLYAATSTGQGPAAAQVLRVGADLSQTFTSTAVCNGTVCTATPIDLGAASDRVYLILYGTGIRNRSALSAVNVTVGGLGASVAYAGTQGLWPGLDQVNVLLPRSLAGSGLVDVVLSVDGHVANRVQIAVK